MKLRRSRVVLSPDCGAGGMVSRRKYPLDTAPSGCKIIFIEALKTGEIAGAGPGVFEHEPSVPPELMELDNVVLMPHRSVGSFETWEEACDLVTANLWTFFRGEPPLTPIP